MNFAPILAVIGKTIDAIPTLIQIGYDVAPLIQGARDAIDHLGTTEAATSDDFKALDAKLAPLEAELQQLAAKAASGTQDA